jgi:hypothetical protein
VHLILPGRSLSRGATCGRYPTVTVPASARLPRLVARGFPAAVSGRESVTPFYDGSAAEHSPGRHQFVISIGSPAHMPATGSHPEAAWRPPRRYAAGRARNRCAAGGRRAESGPRAEIADRGQAGGEPVGAAGRHRGDPLVPRQRMRRVFARTLDVTTPGPAAWDLSDQSAPSPVTGW